MAVLTADAVIEQARKPECGARPGIDAERILVVARQESGLDPLIIGVNEDKKRRLPHESIRSSTPAQAVARAAALLAAGRSIDLGLVGINAVNLARDGLTLATAFDPCASIRASYHHLAGDFETAAWTLAHRLYNSGSTERGIAYAASIQAMVRKVQFGTITDPSQSARLPPITIRPRSDNDDDMIDLRHDRPSRPVNASPPAGPATSDHKEIEPHEDR